jgi:hypothetical protein
VSTIIFDTNTNTTPLNLIDKQFQNILTCLPARIPCWCSSTSRRIDGCSFRYGWLRSCCIWNEERRLLCRGELNIPARRHSKIAVRQDKKPIRGRWRSDGRKVVRSEP